MVEEGEMGEAVLRRWRRWMKVVFSAWVGESGAVLSGAGAGAGGAIEFEIRGEGICAVGRERVGKRGGSGGSHSDDDDDNDEDRAEL